MAPNNRPPLTPLDDALEALLQATQGIKETETVSTMDALGRVLAQDVVAEMSVPAFANSAMDGYAFALDDWSMAGKEGLSISQRVPAGHAPEALQRGTCVRIFTGAPLPKGADTVVMQENVVIKDDAVHIQGEVYRGQMVRQVGEDIAVGQTVITAGSRLSAADLGMAASLGVAQLSVYRPVKVALFSTGNELQTPGDIRPQDLPPGAIFNSNRYFLTSLLKQLGCQVTDMGVVPDQLEATQRALSAVAATHDVVLTSGGVSVGEEDHVKPAVESLGSLSLWSIAIKPGKPFASGWLRRPDGSQAHFIGLPGNPVSSYVTFAVLVRPFLCKLQGRDQCRVHPMTLQANFEWPKADKRREFLRVKRNASGGLDLFPNQGSGVLTSLAWADGFVDNPPGKTIAFGDNVRFIPLAALFGVEG
ncbi:MAG: hypothetical protein RL357_474 [Pseudomonadota bacterium]